MRIPLRSDFALLWIALAMPFFGCAQWPDSTNAFRSRGEIQGRVEIVAGAPSSSATAESSSSAEKEILVLLEPVTERFSLAPFWRVQDVAIRTSTQSPGIELVTTDRPIRIRNLDSFHHQLFSTNAENPMRIQLAGNSESVNFRLASPGLVRFYCALHPGESHTFIASATSTYHAFVDSGMRFRIPDVRPGRYRVRAASALDWGESETVEIVTAKTVLMTLRLKPEPEL